MSIIKVIEKLQIFLRNHLIQILLIALKNKMFKTQKQMKFCYKEELNSLMKPNNLDLS